ncbi:hypothetical protein EYM_03910 [Ignicoccus islandicus DSM 13165]|uniref:Uncharacterized protein n=1 Tax=Ignicoccus islandicus DSM 13165 TaxID=940295 RepID=A0A0U2VEL5_9CREN|nr:hypothetical protein [Ignicoccus islandicus]ALU12450.1 hypothetical protein EYM_03910 [Ignicoccus islandicus DSM 13165]
MNVSTSRDNDFDYHFLTYMLTKIDQWKRDVMEVCNVFEIGEEEKRKALSDLDRLEEEILDILIFH